MPKQTIWSPRCLIDEAFEPKAKGGVPDRNLRSCTYPIRHAAQPTGVWIYHADCLNGAPAMGETATKTRNGRSGG